MANAPRRLTLALTAALVVLAVVGAGSAWAIGRSHHVAGDPSRAGAPTDTTPTVGTPETSEATATASAPTMSGGQDGVIDGSTSAGDDPSGHSSDSGDPTARACDPVTVTLSAGAEGTAHARDVVDLLSRYFTAINCHDYDAWLNAVTTVQGTRDRDRWTMDYSTTYDSDIYISDITLDDPTTVRMQFTSHQSIEFAPEQVPAECVRWDVTYKVLDEGVGLRVGTSTKDPAMAAC